MPRELTELVGHLDDLLADRGIARTGAVIEPRVRPWSIVLSAATTAGRVWLKAPGPGVRFEVALYEVLARHVPGRILTPLALDASRGLLLLPDGGDGMAEDDDLRPVLAAYARLQRDLTGHVDELLAAGVPDMRPGVMLARFDEAVDYAGAELDPRVRALRARFGDWCAELAALPGGASLDHNDLYPHNVLRGPVFYDWGDACVAHPFACLLVPLRMAGVGDAARDAYLAEFADLAPHAELVRIADLACRVAIVARALTWKRALADQPAGDYAGAAADHLALLVG